MATRYKKSEEFLERARKVIPLGSQTFSKSLTQYPHGVSPYFIERGRGSHVWDIDGNEYIDFVSSLAAVNLGYNDADVNQAVAEQLKQGVIFSLPHRLETEVAEKIAEMVPCAEMVRFGKNGSDATSGAIRLARAYTGRDRVAVCGYHGWQDWYIGSTLRNRGVPKAVRELTHTFQYNNIESLNKLFTEHRDEFAAVILEPMNAAYPEKEFLAEAKALTNKHGALFIFDETITGFRYSNGGAQELFGVTPDLATFGKGMANGFPVSAVAGRADVMKLMEEIFFSFTFGGETLSLAAALATMQKMQKEPVVATMKKRGEMLMSGLSHAIEQNRLGSVLALVGHPTWSFLTIKDHAHYTQWQIRTLYLQEMFRRGILTIGSHNMCYSHSEDDISRMLSAFGEVAAMIASGLESRNLERLLECKVLEPLFRVR